MSWINNIDLPQLIYERKQEKRLVANKKLNHDLEVISKRRVSKDELEPFPGGSFNRLMRENIWEDILRQINDPSDVTSTFVASKSFANVLEKRRNLNLLPQIFSILEENEFLCKRDLLSLRRTSKSWKRIAEHEIFESSLVGESWYTYLDEIYIYDRDPLEKRCLWSIKSVDNALTALSKSEGKEISLVRKLCVDRSRFNLGYDEPMFPGKVVDFLEIYGESVWLFMYKGNLEMQDYDNLWHMLMKMPNLKAVAFNWITKPTEECSADEIILIEDMLERTSFPMLDSLEYVQLLSNENELFLKHVYGSCSNDLKSVYHIGQTAFTEAVSTQMKRFSLERLEGPADTLILSPNFANWPLKVLETKDVFNSTNSSVSLTALNRFQGTLEHLKMDLSIKKDDDSVFLQLPKLKCLQLGTISGGSIGFDDEQKTKCKGLI